MTLERKLSLTAAVIALLIYANSLFNGFVMDDRYTVVENQRLKNIQLIETFTTPWGAGATREQDKGINANYYRPITELSLALDYQIWGLKAFGYHLTNILIYALIAYLIAGIFFRLGISAFGLFFFIVHPVHTEVVNLISYRAELLSALSYVTVIFLYLDLTKEGKRKKSVDYLLLPLIFLIGVLAKESSITLPAITLLFAFFYRQEQGKWHLSKGIWKKRIDRQALGLIVALGVVALFYLGLRQLILTPSSTINFFAGLDPFFKILSVAKIYLFNVKLFLIPYPLCPFYEWTILPPAASLADSYAWIGVFFFALTLFMIIYYRSSRPIISFALAFYLFALLPTLHLVALPVGAAERFLFIPSIGISIIVGVLAARINKRLLKYIIIAILTLFALISFNRNFDWKNDIRLEEQVVKDFPNGSYGHYHLGELYAEKGRYKEALKSFQRADQLLPGMLTTSIKIATVYLKLDQKQNAKYVIENAIKKHGPLPYLLKLLNETED